MRLKNPFKDLSKFELGLWISSVLVIIVSFVLAGGDSVLNTVASVIGVTALIFVAKGYVLGQVLTVVFAVFYGIISFFMKYYGEMITYMFMTAPIAIMAVVSWIRHPYEGTKEVQVNKLNRKQVYSIIIFGVIITTIFFFILRWLNNASLIVSTVSITTSFVASYLTFLRSPYYALAYAANDIVLIILWVIATVKELSYLPMVLCFVMFFANDIYGYYNWQRMRKRQEKINK